jgi:hypothetical protein
MKRNVRAILRVGAVGAAAAVFGLVTVAGQAPAPAGAPPAPPQRTKSTYQPPKTPWGEPDIGGMFNFSYVGTVPLERPCQAAGGGGRPGGGPGAGAAAAPGAPAAGRAGGGAPGAGAPPAGAAPAAGGQGGGRQGGGAGGGGGRGGGRGVCDHTSTNYKAFLTDEEYNAATGRAAGRGDGHAAAIASGNYGRALLSGVTDPTTVQRQTSLIVDPPNGRLPELTPEGKRLSALMKSSWALTGETGQTWDGPEDFDSWDRCITRGLPASMGPYRYNNGMQILQAPGLVVLNLEMIHETRMIYTDNRPAVNPVIQEYMGESRGHWENGNTLVFTTTNIHPGASMTNIGIAGSPNGNRTPASDKLKLTERITRLSKDMIEYEMTVEDPVVLTRSWTMRVPLKEEPTYEWWEYACHEGNSVIPNYVHASRAEREAARSGGAAPAAPAGGAPAAPAGGGRQGRGQ